MKTINVKEQAVSILRVNNEDYISITDIARFKNPKEPKDVVKNWLRNRSTIEYLGLWEKINNPEFKGVEFDPFNLKQVVIVLHFHLQNGLKQQMLLAFITN